MYSAHNYKLIKIQITILQSITFCIKTTIIGTIAINLIVDFNSSKKPKKNYCKNDFSVHCKIFKFLGFDQQK